MSEQYKRDRNWESDRVRRTVGAMAAYVVLLLGAVQSDAGPVLFISNQDTSQILRSDSKGTFTVFGSVPSSQGAEGLAFDNAGNLYAAGTGGTIKWFSPTGQDLGTFAQGQSGTEGLAFDNAGNLYVANQATNSIHRFSPTGQDLGNFATGLNGPSGLAFDTSGNLYVADFNGNTIEKLSPNGQKLGTITDLGGQTFDVAFDKAGNLYASISSNIIQKFSPTGQDLGVFASTGLNVPFGLAFDDSGNLFIANLEGASVREFSPTGQDLGNYVTGLNLPTFLAFQPVPEPSGMALLASGAVCGLGYWWCRRKRGSVWGHSSERKS